MSAPKRRSTKDQVRILRAKQRGFTKAIIDLGEMLRSMPHVPISPSRTGPPQFIQCWAVSRGGFNAVTQALDSHGQVWERFCDMGAKPGGGKEVKDSWWIPLSMQRKALTKKEGA